ncbi:MAG: hypothetical protein CME45_01705 [Halieaceae bacterium]|nr:hypothetical protein [Halieaceae bacterium]
MVLEVFLIRNGMEYKKQLEDIQMVIGKLSLGNFKVSIIAWLVMILPMKLILMDMHLMKYPMM